MLAGDVAAAVLGGDLFLTGDAADNQFEIVRDVTQATPGAGEVTIRGLLGTTINGQAEVTFNGSDAVTGDVSVDLSAGGIDTVTIGEAGSTDPLVLLDDILVDAGSTGEQNVLVTNVDLTDSILFTSLASEFAEIEIADSAVGGDARVNSAADVNFLVLRETTIGGDAELSSTGVTDSLLDAFLTTIGDDLILTASSEISELAFGDITVGDDVVVDVTSEEHTVDITVSDIGDDLLITTGAGFDEIGLFQINIADDLVVNSGDGENLVEVRESTVGDDFRLVDGDNGVDPGTLQVFDSTFGDDVYVSGNGGADAVLFERSTVGDNFRASGGDGDDVITLIDSAIADSLLISLDRGVDQTTVTDVSVGRDLTVLGRDDNTVLLQDVAAIRSARVFTSGGQDEVTFRNVDTHFALIATSAGIDNVLIGSSQVTGQPPELSEIDLLFVFLGAGDDTLTLEGVDAGFALLSGGSGTDTLVDAEDQNDITFDIDFAFEDFQVV